MTGVLKIVFGIHEGFQSMPKLYGSEVRQQGKVTDFSSGVSEAAKVFEFLCTAVSLNLTINTGIVLWLL